jgi:two-component system response regulator YesN
MFKKETGKTMTEYLNEIRIEKACNLLTNPEYKIYQVGEMVGIPNSYYFSRIFKKSIGCTPSEYRQKNTG